MAGIIFTDEFVSKLTTPLPQLEVYDAGFPSKGSFGLRLSRKGKKAYFLIYSLNGKRKRLTLGDASLYSLEEAQCRARKILREAEKGRDPAAERRAYKQSPNFGELCSRYLREHAYSKLKDTTAKEYERIIQRELIPQWGDLKIVDIEAEQIQRLVEQIDIVRKKPVLAARVRATASSLFSYATSQKLILGNPVKVTTPPPSPPPPPPRVLSSKELSSFWQVLAHWPPYVSCPLKLILLTGQRPGAVLSMCWQEISFGIWRVNSHHSIYLTPQVVSLIEQLRKSASPSPFLFPSPRQADKPFCSLRQATREISNKIGLARRFNPLDLRRTSEALLCSLGIRADVINHLLDRRSATSHLASFTTDYDFSSELKSALLLLAKHIFALVGHTPEDPEGKVIKLFG